MESLDLMIGQMEERERAIEVGNGQPVISVNSDYHIVSLLEQLPSEEVGEGR